MDKTTISWGFPVLVLGDSDITLKCPECGKAMQHDEDKYKCPNRKNGKHRYPSAIWESNE